MCVKELRPNKTKMPFTQVSANEVQRRVARIRRHAVDNGEHFTEDEVGPDTLYLSDNT